jgi:hypothetical protein
MCLEKGCFVLLLEKHGDAPKDVAFTVCGLTGSHSDVIRLCVDAYGACSASLIAPPPLGCAAANTSQVDFHMFSPSNHGWGGNGFALTDAAGITTVVAPPASTSSEAFVSAAAVCLADGCYDYRVGGDNSSAYASAFWTACDVKGAVPWSTQLCVDFSHQLCYGLSGCPVLKTYARTHNKQWYVVYDDSGQLLSVDNAHSAHELCELDDGCYNIFVGAGITYDSAASTSVSLCGSSLEGFNSRARFCVNGTIYSHNAYGVQETACDVVPSAGQVCEHSAHGSVVNPIMYVCRSLYCTVYL